MTLRKQLVFMVKDAWKSRGRRSQIDWNQATALRHSTRPSGAGRGSGPGLPSGAAYQVAADANERYLESFEKKT